MNASNGLGLDDDAALARLLEEVSNRLAAGEAVDLDSYAASFPQYADELKSLMPVLERLAGLSRMGGHSSGKEKAPPPF